MYIYIYTRIHIYVCNWQTLGLRPLCIRLRGLVSRKGMEGKC